MNLPQKRKNFDQMIYMINFLSMLVGHPLSTINIFVNVKGQGMPKVLPNGLTLLHLGIYTINSWLMEGMYIIFWGTKELTFVSCLSIYGYSIPDKKWEVDDYAFYIMDYHILVHISHL